MNEKEFSVTGSEAKQSANRVINDNTVFSCTVQFFPGRKNILYIYPVNVIIFSQYVNFFLIYWFRPGSFTPAEGILSGERGSPGENTFFWNSCE